MILRSLLNRDPKWQSADPAERAAAAAQLQPSSPELNGLAADPDAGVRAAALARTADLAVLKARMDAETDAAAKSAAQRRAVELLAGKSAEPLPVGERQSALDAGWPDEILERIIGELDDPGLQQRALAGIRDEAALARIATSRAHVELRGAAIDMITDRQTLGAVARALKGHDKGLWRRAQARLDSYRDNERRDQDAASQLAALEALAAAPVVAGNQLAAIERSWQALHYGDGPLAGRYAEALSRARARLQEGMQSQQAAQRVIAALADLVSKLPPDGTDLLLLDALESGLAAQKLEWDNIGGPSLPRLLQSQYSQRRIELEERLATLRSDAESLARRETLLDRIAEYLDQGNVTGARTLLGQWRQLPPPRPSAGRAAQDNRFVALREREAAARHEAPAVAADASAGVSAQGEQAPVDAESPARPAGPVAAPAPPAAEDAGPSALEAAVDALEAAMNEGAFAHARKCHDALAEALAKVRHPAPALARRVEAARLRFAELAGWQRWGSAQAHEQLCAEAEALIQATLPVPELARSVQALRERWKALDKEQGTAPGNLWHRFDKACTKAYEPARRHFAEEAKKRAERLAAREAFCTETAARAQQLAESDAPAKSLQRELESWRRGWRELGPVDRPKWKELDQRFDAAVSPVKAKVDEVIERSRARRRQLIEDARALAGQPLRAAIGTVRTLQQSWKDEAAAVMLPRGEEQRLWEAFRGACNALFERRDAEAQAAAGKHQSIVAAKTALLDELEQLAGQGGPENAGRLQKALGELERRWRESGHAGRDEERRLGERRARIEATARAQTATARRSRHLAVFDVITQRATLCAAAEALSADDAPERERTLGELREQWAAAPKLPPELEAPLRQRFERAAGAASATDPSPAAVAADDAAELRRELALRAEILAAIDSPVEESRQRMALRVEYLNRSVSGDSPNALAEMQSIAARWHAFPGATAPALHARFERALRAFQSKSMQRGGEHR